MPTSLSQLIPDFLMSWGQEWSQGVNFLLEDKRISEDTAHKLKEAHKQRVEENLSGLKKDMGHALSLHWLRSNCYNPILSRDTNNTLKFINRIEKDLLGWSKSPRNYPLEKKALLAADLDKLLFSEQPSDQTQSIIKLKNVHLNEMDPAHGLADGLYLITFPKTVEKTPTQFAALEVSRSSYRYFDPFTDNTLVKKLNATDAFTKMFATASDLGSETIEFCKCDPEELLEKKVAISPQMAIDRATETDLLTIAIHLADANSVKYILGHSSPHLFEHYSPLDQLIEGKNDHLLHLFLQDERFDIDKTLAGQSLLMWILTTAPESEKLAYLQELIQHASTFEKFLDANQPDSLGNPPLINAVINGSTEEVSALLELPSLELNVLGNEGKNALMLATENEQEEIIALLLADARADTNYIFAVLEGFSEKGYLVATRNIQNLTKHLNEKQSQDLFLLAITQNAWVVNALLTHASQNGYLPTLYQALEKHMNEDRSVRGLLPGDLTVITIKNFLDSWLLDWTQEVDNLMKSKKISQSAAEKLKANQTILQSTLKDIDAGICHGLASYWLLTNYLQALPISQRELDLIRSTETEITAIPQNFKEAAKAYPYLKREDFNHVRELIWQWGINPTSFSAADKAELATYLDKIQLLHRPTLVFPTSHQALLRDTTEHVRDKRIYALLITQLNYFSLDNIATRNREASQPCKGKFVCNITDAVRYQKILDHFNALEKGHYLISYVMHTAALEVMHNNTIKYFDSNFDLFEVKPITTKEAVDKFLYTSARIGASAVALCKCEAHPLTQHAKIKRKIRSYITEINSRSEEELLHIAIWAQDIKGIKYILKKSIDNLWNPSTKLDFSVMRRLLPYNNEEIFALFFADRRMDINEKLVLPGRENLLLNPLKTNFLGIILRDYFSKNQKLNYLRMLIAHAEQFNKSIEVNDPDIWPSPPFNLAIEFKNSVAVLTELLKIPYLDLKREDKEGNSALLVAAEYKNTAAIKLLLADARVDTNYLLKSLETLQARSNSSSLQLIIDQLNKEQTLNLLALLPNTPAHPLANILSTHAKNKLNLDLSLPPASAPDSPSTRKRRP